MANINNNISIGAANAASSLIGAGGVGKGSVERAGNVQNIVAAATAANTPSGNVATAILEHA